MTARELTEWQAFNLYVEPFGGELLDMHFASLRMQNYAGKDKKTIKDFMLYDHRLLTPEQKEQERQREKRLQENKRVSALRDFLASKVNEQKIASKS